MNTRAAVRHLKRTDVVMAAIIERVGTCRAAPYVEGTHFDAVLQSIVYQQLSGKAAATIHGRLQVIYGDRAPLPHEILSTTDDALRAVGLSRQKIGYLRDLATRILAGEVPIDTLHDLSDEEIIAALTRVKGVGRWTAQMFLMFRLGRPNVLPELDLGIQKAIQLAYRLRSKPSPERVLKIGARWIPYRTVASWYLWRSLELPRPGAS